MEQAHCPIVPSVHDTSGKLPHARISPIPPFEPRLNISASPPHARTFRGNVGAPKLARSAAREVVVRDCPPCSLPYSPLAVTISSRLAGTNRHLNPARSALPSVSRLCHQDCDTRTRWRPVCGQKPTIRRAPLRSGAYGAPQSATQYHAMTIDDSYPWRRPVASEKSAPLEAAAGPSVNQKRFGPGLRRSVRNFRFGALVSHFWLIGSRAHLLVPRILPRRRLLFFGGACAAGLGCSAGLLDWLFSSGSGGPRFDFVDAVTYVMRVPAGCE